MNITMQLLRKLILDWKKKLFVIYPCCWLNQFAYLRFFNLFEKRGVKATTLLIMIFTSLSFHRFFLFLIFMTQVADRELSEAKLELSRSRTELEKQDMDLVKLRAELSRLAQDNKQLTNTLNSQTNDMSKLESLVDKLQEDKQRLSVRVNKLISTGEL